MKKEIVNRVKEFEESVKTIAPGEYQNIILEPEDTERKNFSS